MKNKILLILFVVIINKSYSQKAKVCGKIEYKQSTHFSRDFSRDFLLTFNNNHSLYQEVNINIEKEKIKTTYTGEGKQIDLDMVRNNLTPEFYYNDRQSFFFLEVWFDIELLVKEDSLNLNWRLKDEIKKIGNFNCQKATTEFRGREYIAWFTKDVLVPFGPWKFQGLPGLIIEIYDTNRVFHIIAKKVKIEKNIDYKLKIDKSKFESSMNIIQFLKRKKELIIEDFAKLNSKLPKGYNTYKYDENCDDCSEDIEIFKNK
jgi:GLPGLI family protein